jgi:hypothetical protein
MTIFCSIMCANSFWMKSFSVISSCQTETDLAVRVNIRSTSDNPVIKRIFLKTKVGQVPFMVHPSY